jgi:HTH DNA binding domain
MKIRVVPRIRAYWQKRLKEPGTDEECDLRRVTIELTLDEMNKFEQHPTMFDKIRSLEILQFLKESPEELAIICRVEFIDPTVRLEEFIDDDTIELQMLDHEKAGTYTYFVRDKPSIQHETSIDFFANGGYLTVPFEISDGKLRMTYLGNLKQVKSFLDGIEKQGIKYKVTNMSDARFPRNSPLSRLTEKQRRVLVTAYRLGYYDEPRRISSLELARKLKVGSSTLINHRRTAERHVLAELIGG